MENHSHLHTTQLDTLPIKKLLWKYALPSIFAMLVSGIYSIVGGIFVGQYVGGEGLAAIGLAYPVVMVQIGLGALIGVGGATQIALAQGRKDNVTAKHALANTIWSLIVLGCILPIIGLFYLDTILQFLSADRDPGLWREGKLYLQWMLAGSFFVSASLAIGFLLRNDGRPTFATILMIFGALANIVFDFILVAVFKLGLAGAALGSLLAEGIVVVVGLGYFFTRYARLSLNLKSFVPHFPSLLPTISLGLSSLMMEINLAFLLFAHNSQLLTYGTEVELAAYAVAGYTESLFLLIIQGLAAGIQPILGYAVGAGQYHRVKETLTRGIWAALTCGCIGLLFVELFPLLIAGFYVDTSDTPLMHTSTDALRLHLSTMPLEGFIILAVTALQSMGLTRQALYGTVGKTLLLVPVLWSLPIWFGVKGIWLAVPVVNIILVVPMMLILARATLKEKFF